MKVAFLGSSYSDNFGDVLLFKLFLSWIKEVVPTATAIIPFAAGAFRKSLEADQYGMRYLPLVDKVVFVGGGYLGEPPTSQFSWSLRNFCRHVPGFLVSQIMSKPIGVFGVGVGPVSSSPYRWFVKELARKSKVFCVRDVESLEHVHAIAGDCGVNLVADAALSLATVSELLPTVRCGSTDSPRKTRLGLHVHVPQSFKEKSCHVIDAILGFCDTRDIEVFFLLDERHQTYSHPVSSRGTVVKYTSVEQLIQSIFDLDVIVTTKLHVGIVAMSLGKRVMGLPFHSKTQRFYSQTRSPFCVPLDRLSVDMLPSLLEDILNSKCFTIPRDVKDLSLLNKTLLHKFLLEA
ncbi:MAG: polysaccharide pyruvyl transferase family protein [Phycisphaerae bacterium]|nr:polysaccharide pyruvyl transferase family protein [Phycisphaerae bacterium]